MCAIDRTGLRQVPLTLLVGPRPGRRSFNHLSQLKLTHLCTLLDEHEDACSIEIISSRLGVKWIWLPISGGRIEALRKVNFLDLFSRLASRLNTKRDNRVYLHCSAGIHRTGFIAYGVFRLRGLSQEAALAELRSLRNVTVQQLGKERIELAEKLLANL